MQQLEGQAYTYLTVSVASSTHQLYSSQNADYLTCQIGRWLRRICDFMFTHLSISVFLSTCSSVLYSSDIFICPSVHPSHLFSQLLISLMSSTSATHLMTGRVFSNQSDIVITGDLHDIHCFALSLSFHS